MKKLVLASLLASIFTTIPCFAKQDKVIKDATIGEGKQPIKLERGDCSLTIGGKTIIENYFQRNVALLNSAIPDEVMYFKNTVDLSFDFAYGEKTFGHDAVKVYTKIRHKGVWGRGAVFADSDGMSPAPIKLSDSTFGGHNHTSGKPLVWINEAWLQFSINAIANVSADRLHTIKLGWFPFKLGRGIALGSVYGLNREGFGLNTYVEDKGAPGMTLHGELKKDVLSYDLYYAVFECRSKSIGDTFNMVKEQLEGRKLSPWRGVGKNNEIFAGRMKWKPLNKSKFGTLELEPYAFFQAASDQKVKVIADSSVNLGSIGLAVEHDYKGFEFGVEGACNLGHQKVHGIDNNKIEMTRLNRKGSTTVPNTVTVNVLPPASGTTSNISVDGVIVEQFSHIVDTRFPVSSSGNTTEYYNALVTDESVKAAQIIVTNDKTPLEGKGIPVGRYQSKSKRILPEYVNKLRGYMVVADISKTLVDYDVVLSAAYGFASGDEFPHKNRVCKTHMGFIGVHECYSGKRVPSVMFLDEMRGNLSIPGAITEDVDKVDNNELSFTNLHHLGFGGKWTPTICGGKKLTFNPNMLSYWRAIATKQFDTVTEKTTNENASRYIGTEFNVKSKLELLKDLEVFGNFGVFIPGRLFTDIKGIPFKNSFGNDTPFFDMLSTEVGPETDGIKQDFRLGTDVAYSLNIGLNYSF